MTKSLKQDEVMAILSHELPVLKERFGVVRLALYGSYAHGSPKKQSDVDLLVELTRPLGFEFVALANYLEERLGRRVDLITFEMLNRSLNHPRYSSIAKAVKETLVDVRTAA